MVVPSVEVPYVLCADTRIDALGTHIIDLCAALVVKCTDETVPVEVVETVIPGVKASYLVMPSFVACSDTLAPAGLSKDLCVGGMSARNKIENLLSPCVSVSCCN